MYTCYRYSIYRKLSNYPWQPPPQKKKKAPYGFHDPFWINFYVLPISQLIIAPFSFRKNPLEEGNIL